MTTYEVNVKPTKLYSSKAEKYAKYRWDYSPQAIEAIIRTAQVTDQSTLAYIGAGPGILTKHFSGRVKRIYAVEPNDKMRGLAEKMLSLYKHCSVLKGRAEAIPLADQSIDLILVAQAIHWFDPAPTRQEFLRILKPNGWLAILRNYGKDQRLEAAIERICVEENGVSLTEIIDRPEQKPLSYYYGHENIQCMTFGFEVKDDWERFIGSLLSASFMPDESHPLYPKLERAAREVFDAFSVGGELRVSGETEVMIGQVGG
jgi:ubiquinone/menaquinone biosynthesis C-methylase UbiE